MFNSLMARLQNTTLVAILLIGLTVSCSSQEQQHKVDKQLTVLQQQTTLLKIIRYIARLPKGVKHEDKFNTRYDAYYVEETKRYKFERFYTDKTTGYQYFSISRTTSSLVGKRLTIGGRLKLDAQENLIEYEEIYRTFRFKPEELQKKDAVLFAEMIQNGNVDAYLSQNTTEEWVEFPDKLNYFDKSAREWKMRTQSLPLKP